MTSAELVVRTAAELESRSRVNAELARMFEAIPEAGENVVEDMLAQLVGITELDQIDSLWNANGLAQYTGRVLMLESMKKLPSDFEDSCGWFMAVSAVVLETGEQVTITTSANLVMAQLIVLHGKGWLPVEMIPRLAQRPTKKGYYPMHLELYRGGPLSPAPVGPPGAKASKAMQRIKERREQRERETAGDVAAAERASMADDTQEVPY